MKSISKKSLLAVMVISLGILLLASCKKKSDDNPNSGDKISMKMTVTVTGADQNDQVDFQVAAGNHDASQYRAPVWTMTLLPFR